MTTTTRGTTNANARGSSADRSTRKSWLLQTYAADLVAVRKHFRSHTEVEFLIPSALEAVQAIWANFTKGHPDNPVTVEVVLCCRCYRCGRLLTFDTLTVDRIVPGCRGGTYRRTNIRPACSHCNSSTGGGVRS